MKVSETNRDISGGGGNQYFKLEEGRTANIRFLYNTVEEIQDEGLVAHIVLPEESGQKFNVTVLCGAKSDATAKEDCKWCATDHKPYARYPLALYNEDQQSIQYWLKSGQYVDGLIAQLREIVPQGKPISGQIFKMIRTGKGTQTQYNILTQGQPQNDGKTPDAFGEIKEPEARGLMRPADYDFATVSNGGTTFQGGNYGTSPFGNYGNYQGTGRTPTNMF